MHWIIEHPIYTGLIAGVIFELVTILLRFGFKMTSPTHTKPIGKLTKGYRVHHGYPGVGMLMMVPVIPSATIATSLILIVGIMLFLSDLIHHAIVLPIFAGHHEFDIKYPVLDQLSKPELETIPTL